MATSRTRRNAGPRRAIAAAILAAGMLAAWQAGAVPRYSARYEQNCALCHVNPGGGGLRTAYAVQDLVPKELAMSSGRPEALAMLDHRLGRNIEYGVDFREVFFASTARASLAPPQGFFLMQADLYMAFQLDPRVTLYYDRGQGNLSEVFGLLHALPFDGWAKAGRFTPAYGWKFDDHTMFVRGEEGFQPPLNTDTGVELGVSPKNTELQVGLFNGTRGGGLDSDRRLAMTANASRRVRAGPVSLLAGVSGYSQPGHEVDLNVGGVFGSLSAWNVTWLGQSDWIRRQQELTGRVQSGLATSHELAVALRRGVEIKGTYDFADPDRHLRTGAKSRWGVTLFAMPRSFVTAEAAWRRTHVDDGPLLRARDFDEGVFQLHLLY
jgi:hypothetical protein